MKRIKEIFIIGTCLLMWVALFGGWSYTLKTSTPAGTDDPREADDRMREIKAAFVERLNIDHYFTASATSTYDHADCGKHRYITFREPNSIVSVAENEAYLYTKDANSIAELHWIDENEAEFQITSDGYLYGNSLKASSVLTAAIADANVTLAKMDVNSIDSDQYIDGSIDTVHIADANVPLAKLDSTAKEGIVKGWVRFDGTGTLDVKDSYNVDSVTDNGTGNYTINWDTDFGDTNYCVVVSVYAVLGNPRVANLLAVAAGTTQIGVVDTAGHAQDVSMVCVMAIGDQ